MEFNWHCERWTEQQKDARRQDIAHAWHIAAMAGAAMVGKLKPLSEYLTTPQQTRVEQRAAMELIAERFGSKVRPRDTSTKVIPFLKAS